MQGSANAFTQDFNMLAALTGRGSPNLVAPAYAATMTLDQTVGLFQQITMTGALALNTVGVGLPGQLLVIEFAASGGTRTATLGANFRSTGTVAPTTGTSIVVAFISNGTKWLEVCRTSAALA
jgi:hypothetical protein